MKDSDNIELPFVLFFHCKPLSLLSVPHRYRFFFFLNIPYKIAMFGLIHSESNSFSVKTDHMLEKEEKYCFCKQCNISATQTGSQTGC